MASTTRTTIRTGEPTKSNDLKYEQRKKTTMGFDPNKHTPTKDQGGNYDDREVPAGVYLLGPSWLQCPTPRSWKMRFEVLMGSFRGASVFVLQGRDTNKTGTQNRLYYYVKSAGLTCVLETNGDGFLTERGLSADVLGHAIKAKVSKKRKGDFTNYDFQAFQAREEWSQAEHDIAARWEQGFAEKRQNETGYGGGGDWSGKGSSDPQDDGFGGDPGPSGGGGGDDWGGGDGW